MAKRCIGIDISSSYLRAVQILRTGEKLQVERVFSAPVRRSTDTLPGMLRSLLNEHGFDGRAEVAVSLPYNAVYFRHVDTDLAGLEQIRQGDSSALQPDFPMEPDEIITQVYSYRQLPDAKYSVLTAALRTQSLRQRLSVLAEARIHPSLAEAPIFALHSAVAVNHPQIATATALIVYVDQYYLTLAVTKDNSILIVRNIPTVSHSDDSVDSAQEQTAQVLLREAEITWRKAFGTGIAQDSKIYLAVADNLCHHLKAKIEQSTNCQVTIVDSFAKLQGPPDGKADGTLCVAEGLALRLLAPERTAGTNFLQVRDATKKPTLDVKRELAICATLVAAISLIWIVGLFLRLSYLETSYGHIRNEIRDIFEKTLPNENMVSPLVQLDQQFDSFRKDYELFTLFYPDSLSALDVLYNITKNTPARKNVNVDDLLIASDTVRLSGTCDSYQSVYDWQQLLRQVPGFTLVDVQDAQKQGGTVNFTIVLYSDVTEQE